MEKTYIYGLYDDKDNLRYIGKSDNPNKRYTNHTFRTRIGFNTHLHCWIKSLFNKGKKPILKIIEEVDYDKWSECERKWIKYYRDNGIDLVNQSDGGDSGRKHDEETKAKMKKAKKEWWNRISKEEKENFVKERQKKIPSRKNKPCPAISKGQQGLSKGNKSGFTGVNITKNNTYSANACGKYLGRFQTKEEAAIIYDKYVINKFGLTAKTNFPKENYIK